MLGILFPVAWVVRFSPASNRVIEAILAPDWMHVLMHAGLYTGLGVLMVFALKMPAEWEALPKAIGVVSAVGAARSPGSKNYGLSFATGGYFRPGRRFGRMVTGIGVRYPVVSQTPREVI